MKTIVYLRLGHDEDDPIAEIRLTDPAAVPNVGDAIQFQIDDTDEDGGLAGTVTKRIFRPLPFHVEIEVIAEPDHS